MEYYKIDSIKALRNMPFPQEATELLNQLVQATRLLLIRRKWRVDSLQEFYPKQSNLLGLNINSGECIKIRLRSHKKSHKFLPFESILGTLVHELVHNEIGAHSFEFYSLLDKLEAEVQNDLLTKRTTINTFPEGKGHKLGGRQPDKIERNLLYEAALKRQLSNENNRSYDLQKSSDSSSSNSKGIGRGKDADMSCFDDALAISQFEDEYSNEEDFIIQATSELLGIDFDPTLLQYCFPIEATKARDFLIWTCDICLERNNTIDEGKNLKMLCSFCGTNQLQSKNEADVIVIEDSSSSSSAINTAQPARKRSRNDEGTIDEHSTKNLEIIELIDE